MNKPRPRPETVKRTAIVLVCDPCSAGVNRIRSTYTPRIPAVIITYHHERAVHFIQITRRMQTPVLHNRQQMLQPPQPFTSRCNSPSD